MAKFVLHNEEYESGYIEGVQENLEITSQSGFSPINVMSQAVKGDYEKETILTGDIDFSSRDTNGTAARGIENLEFAENIGVKASYKTKRVKIPYADIARSGFSNEMYSNALGKKAAQAEMKYVLSLALKSAITAMEANAAIFVPTGAAWDKKDFIEAMRPLKDQAQNIQGWLTSTGLGFDLLAEATDKNRYGESGVVYGASAGTFNIPMMTTALPALMDTTKHYLMGLYEDAIEIKLNSTAPSVVIKEWDDEENHYQTWSLDGACNIKLRNTPFIGTSAGNATEAILTTPANWGKTGSDTNLMGSLTKVGA